MEKVSNTHFYYITLPFTLLLRLCMIIITLPLLFTGRKRIRNYSVAEASRKNQRTQKHKATRERVEMKELTTNSGVVLVNSAQDAPQLSPHAAVVQQLQATLSTMQQQNPPTSVANLRETSTSSTGGAINSTSTNTTVVVDIEDSGMMEEPVFLETETKSDVLAKSGHLLNHPSRSCVSTCGRGSHDHECTKATTAGQTMNLIPCQKNADSRTGNGLSNNHRISHREPETDYPSYVNITGQASVHTTEQSSALQYSLSQPLLTEGNLESPTYVNHTEIPFCQCRACRMSDDKGCGYVNVPTQSSLLQPLSDDNNGSDRNQTQAQSCSELDRATESVSLPPFKRQTSAPTNAAQANEKASTGHHGHSDGNDLVHGYVNIFNLKRSEMISPLEHQKSANSHPLKPTSKSPNQLRSLPPRTQQPTTGHYESSLQTISAQRSNSYYEDASSLAPKMLRQTILTRTETAVCGGHSKSNKSCSTTTCDRGYVNVTKPRSISQPTPITADMLNPSLIPPRTILRANFCQPTASDSKSSNAVILPPRPRSKTTQHVHPLPPSSSETLPPPLTLSATLLPAEDLQLTKSIEIETKSSSGCSSGSSVQLDSTVQAKKRYTHKKSKSSSRNTCRERGCSCESISDASYVVDELESSKRTESVESLDIWLPVIPRQTELMFIVAHNQPESDQKGGGLQDDHTDTDTKSIKMTVNRSYVKR